MLVSDLLAYGVVPSELALLRPYLPERLRPLQELAVRRGLLRLSGGDDLLIVGEPGAGQGALIELLLVHAEHCGVRVQKKAAPLKWLGERLTLFALDSGSEVPRTVGFLRGLDGAEELLAELGAKLVMLEPSALRDVDLLARRWAEASLGSASEPRAGLEALCVVTLGLSPSVLPLSRSWPLELLDGPAMDARARVLDEAARLGQSERPLFQWLRSEVMPLATATSKALKWALLLQELLAADNPLSAEASAALERRYDVSYQTLAPLIAKVSLRLQTLAETCLICGFTPKTVAWLRDLAARLLDRSPPGESDFEEVPSPKPSRISTKLGVVVGALHAQKPHAGVAGVARDVIMDRHAPDPLCDVRCRPQAPTQ